MNVVYSIFYYSHFEYYTFDCIKKCALTQVVKLNINVIPSKAIVLVMDNIEVIFNNS